MPYRLQNAETVRDGVRRVGREQLDAAITELTAGVSADPVKAVRGARKALKKERSLLRLGRGGLSKDRRRREAGALRDVARRLGGIRDSDVMVQSLGDLADRFAGQVPAETFAAIRAHLVGQTGATRRPPNSQRISDAVQELTSARRRSEDWRLRGSGWSVVGDGLVLSYRRGRNAFEVARVLPTPENLHEWRKRAKDMWYHLRLLRPLSPRVLRGQAQDAHRLSDLLGDDHDLAVLRDVLHRIDGEIPADVDPVIGLIEHRRDQLQSEAFFLGARLYAERPKAFRRRMHAYWKTWRAETKAVDSRRPAELAQATRSAAH